MFKKIALFAVAPLLFLAAFATSSYAAGAAAGDDGSLLELARPVWDALRSGQWWLGGALALVLAVAAARQYGGAYVPWFKTGAGAAVLTLLGSFGMALAVGLGQASMSWHLAWVALTFAVSAAGAYSLLKYTLVDMVLVPLAEKYPKFRPILAVILWVFDRVVPKDPPAPAAREKVQDHRPGEHPAYTSAPPPAARRDHRP